MTSFIKHTYNATECMIMLTFCSIVILSLEWTPEDGRRSGRQMKTWQDAQKIRFGRDGCGLERLPVIVTDGGNLSPDAPLGTGGTKSR